MLKSAAMKLMAPLGRADPRVLFRTITKPVTKTNSFFFYPVGELACLAAKGIMLYCRPAVWIGTRFHDHTGRMVGDAFLFVRAMLKHFGSQIYYFISIAHAHRLEIPATILASPISVSKNVECINA